MTPGKFIISATPSARGWRRIARISSGPNGPRGDSKSDAGTHDGAITNTSSGSPSVAPSSHSTPSSAGDVGDLVRVADDRGRPARHDGARELRRRELRRLEVHVRVDEARARGTARRASIRSPPSYAPTPAIRPSTIATSPSSHSRVKAENTRAP